MKILSPFSFSQRISYQFLFLAWLTAGWFLRGIRLTLLLNSFETFSIHEELHIMDNSPYNPITTHVLCVIKTKHSIYFHTFVIENLIMHDGWRVKWVFHFIPIRFNLIAKRFSCDDMLLIVKWTEGAPDSDCFSSTFHSIVILLIFCKTSLNQVHIHLKANLIQLEWMLQLMMGKVEKEAIRN